MSFALELDLSFAPSALVESIMTSQGHSKKRSPIWAYCRNLIENENQDLLYCSHCLLDLTPPPYGMNLLENMRTYLKRHHQITIEKALSKNQAIV
jgi:hypothetical protein